MAILNQLEFREYCGFEKDIYHKPSSATLRKWMERQTIVRVIENRKIFIDTLEPKNQNVINKQLAIKEKSFAEGYIFPGTKKKIYRYPKPAPIKPKLIEPEPIEPEPEPEPLDPGVLVALKSSKPKPAQQPRKLPSAVKTIIKNQNVSAKTETSSETPIEKQLKIEELKLKKLKIIEQELKNEKIQGSVIPVDIVSSLFAIHTKSLIDSFFSACDLWTGKIVASNKLSRVDASAIKKDLLKKINLASEKAITVSKKEISNVISEYQEVRGRGEKK